MHTNFDFYIYICRLQFYNNNTDTFISLCFVLNVKKNVLYQPQMEYDYADEED